MRFSTRQLTTVALAMLGSMVVHQFAYLLASQLFAGELTAIDHSHLSTQRLLITPVAVLVSAAFIVRKVRSLGLTADVNPASVLWLLIALYVGQEAAEFAVQGHGVLEVFRHPPVLIGMVLAPLVVKAFLFTLDRAEAILRFLLVPHRAVVVETRPLVASQQRFLHRPPWRITPTRGPPTLDIDFLFAP